MEWIWFGFAFVSFCAGCYFMGKAHGIDKARKLRAEQDREAELIAKGWRWRTIQGSDFLTPPPPPVRSAKTVATREGSNG